MAGERDWRDSPADWRDQRRAQNDRDRRIIVRMALNTRFYLGFFIVALLCASSGPIIMIQAFNAVEKYDAATCAGGMYLQNERTFSYYDGFHRCKVHVDTHPVLPNGTVNEDVTVRLRYPALPRKLVRRRRWYRERRDCRRFLRRIQSTQTFGCFVEDARAPPGTRMEGFRKMPIGVEGWYVLLVALYLLSGLMIFYLGREIHRGRASATNTATATAEQKRLASLEAFEARAKAKAGESTSTQMATVTLSAVGPTGQTETAETEASANDQPLPSVEVSEHIEQVTCPKQLAADNPGDSGLISVVVTPSDSVVLPGYADATASSAITGTEA